MRLWSQSSDLGQFAAKLLQWKLVYQAGYSAQPWDLKYTIKTDRYYCRLPD